MCVVAIWNPFAFGLKCSFMNSRSDGIVSKLPHAPISIDKYEVRKEKFEKLRGTLKLSNLNMRSLVTAIYWPVAVRKT